MCGIYCSIQQNKKQIKDNVIEQEVKNMLKRRGPDACSVLSVGNDEISIVFFGAVLWQQGDTICRQPVERGDITLVFNGDVFNADLKKFRHVSDTLWLAESLSMCKDDNEICHFLQEVEGPYSLVFYNKCTQNLYFCRDSLGRNSLIFEKKSSQFRLVSTSYHYVESSKKAMELPPLGLFKLNVAAPYSWNLYPWSVTNPNLTAGKQMLEQVFDISLSLKTSIGPLWLKTLELKNSFDFHDMCNMSGLLYLNPFEEFLKNENLLKALDTFSTLLQKSVETHIQLTPPFCKNCVKNQNYCNHAKVAILFSGGIDCSILAVLANKFILENDPIDLINVAFEKVDTQGEVDWNVPDRISAKASLLELRQICPSRKWNFIEVNVSRTDTHNYLQNHIKHLIYPLDSVLDESIGCAFWFASRGEGSNCGENYATPARIVLVGSGADELFGGYVRHRNAYSRHKGVEQDKLLNLHKELENDLLRLPSRNLARDDRIIADNGRTLRVPFVEEHLMQYVRSLSPSQRCCFLLKEGVGEKLFLRLYGYQLGLRSVATMKKRAIQFGSRIANKKQNAADKSQYLKF